MERMVATVVGTVALAAVDMVAVGATEVATAVEATAAAMGAAMAVEEVEVVLVVVTGCPTLAPASENKIGVSCHFCCYCVDYDTNQRFKIWSPFPSLRSPFTRSTPM